MTTLIIPKQKVGVVVVVGGGGVTSVIVVGNHDVRGGVLPYWFVFWWLLMGVAGVCQA